MKEELKSLVNVLEKLAEKEKEKAVQHAGCDYLKGSANGSSQTYELCATWIKEIIEKENGQQRH